MRRLSLIFAVLIASHGLFYFSIYYLNDGFSLQQIQGDPPSICEVESQDQEPLKRLLSQKFYYLGKGSQSYVFESEDHEVVLKFFRLSRYRPHFLTQYLSYPQFMAALYEQKMEEKRLKLAALLESCQIAHQKLQEDCGLVYLHLNKSHDLHQKVILCDRLQRSYDIELDEYLFVLQKKGEPLLPYLNRLFEEGKKEEARAALTDLAHLLARRIEKGIYDHDAMIHKNSGFTRGKAFFLDVGSFSEKPSDPDEMAKITHRLRNWIEEKDPEFKWDFQNVDRYHE